MRLLTRCLVVLSLLLGGVHIAVLSQVPSVETAPVLLPLEEMAPYALAHAQQEVLKALLTPSVATFPPTPPPDVLPIPVDLRPSPTDHAWFILGTVDSQNAFGAMIRNMWLVRISYHCALSRDMIDRATCWTIEHLDMWHANYVPKTGS